MKTFEETINIISRIWTKLSDEEKDVLAKLIANTVQ